MLWRDWIRSYGVGHAGGVALLGDGVALEKQNDAKTNSRAAKCSRSATNKARQEAGQSRHGRQSIVAAKQTKYRCGQEIAARRAHRDVPILNLKNTFFKKVLRM